jgi:hypothetical protein
LKPPRFSFGEIAATQGVQIFGSVASSRSQLEGAMRNSRQRCRSAAISPVAAAGQRKHLQSRLNLSSAIFGRRPVADHTTPAHVRDGMGFKQKLPEA